MKRLAIFVLILLSLFVSVTADVVRPAVFHAPSKSKAPFFEVHTVDQNPLRSEAEMLKIVYINIGVGDAMLIECGGERMLIDGGTTSRFPRLEKFLIQENITSFDYLFITHAHDDHIQGPIKILEKEYSVGQVISMHPKDYRNPEHLKLVAAAESKQVPFRQIIGGDTMMLGGAQLTFLNNPDRPSNRTINHISMMLHLRFGSATMLLTSDASGESLDVVVRDYPDLMKCDIMKSPHHGLNRLTVPFITATQPQLVVITSNMEGGKTLAAQLIRNQIPHYYISMGTVHTQTDGENWYIWQDLP